MVARNLYRDDQAQVVMTGEDGLKSFFLVDEVQKDEHGFAVDAPIIGESFKPLPQTVAQQHLDEVEQHVFGTTSKEETEAARKSKALPFGDVSTLTLILNATITRPTCQNAARKVRFEARASSSVRYPMLRRQNYCVSV
jgi:hypothetical protein